MPKRVWAVRSGSGTLKTKAGPVRVKPSPQDVQFASDLDEAERDRRWNREKNDKLLRDHLPLKRLQKMNKLKGHEGELRKFKQKKFGI